MVTVITSIPWAFRGKRLKAKREARKMSQRMLANAVGTTVTTISRLENGVVEDPAGSTVIGLSTVLGINPLTLYERTERSK